MQFIAAKLGNRTPPKLRN